MAGRTSMMIIIMLFFLIFYINAVSVVAVNTTTSTIATSTTSLNTTQFDNFTIEWEDFSLFTCSVPIAIDVSLFACFPPTTYGYIDDITCLDETIFDFDQSTCQISTTAAMYTTSYPITTQQMTTVTTATTKIPQALTSTSSARTQSTVQTTMAGTTSHGSTINGTTAITSASTTAVTTRTSINTTPVTTHNSTATITNSTSTASSVTNRTSTTTNTANSSVNTTTTTAGYNNINTTTTAIGSTTSTGYGNVSTTATTIGSTTTTTANIYTCYPEGYIGTYCNISSDACAMSQPCLNAATCFPNNTLPLGYLCECQTGYTGYNCQYNDNPCMQNTCWNNGTCISASTTINANNESNFRCECVQGYDGVYCELQIDLCGNITCENRGMCETEELMWKCVCLDPTLYYGPYCQYKTGKLKLQQILSKSFASIAIGAIITTCSFVVIMDVLKYAFHIDPVEAERESYRKRLEDRRRARRPIKNYEPKLALRFQYVS